MSPFFPVVVRGCWKLFCVFLSHSEFLWLRIVGVVFGIGD